MAIIMQKLEIISTIFTDLKMPALLANNQQFY